MKKFVRYIISVLISTAVFVLLCMPVYADSTELLQDSGFENGITTYWRPYVSATLKADTKIKHSGSNSVFCSKRTTYFDCPRQDITKLVADYGVGTYKVSAWVYLTGSDANVKLVILSQSEDTTFGTAGKRWDTTSFAAAKVGGWTHIEGELTLTKPANSGLNLVLFYIAFEDNVSGNTQDFYMDDCSLIKVGYVAPPTATPTTVPTAVPSSAPTVVIAPTAAATQIGQVIATESPAPVSTDKSNIQWVWYLVAFLIILCGVMGGVMFSVLSNKAGKNKDKNG